MKVHEVIFEQLGGSAFQAMTGAKDILFDSTGIQFRVGRNPKRVTHVRITLDPSDTYTVEFFRIRKLELIPVSSFELVYFDMLQPLFTSETGLETHL